MANPVSDLLALRRVPGALAGDLHAIAEALRDVPAITQMLSRLVTAIDPMGRNVERLRNTVEPQQERVAHIERMMEALSQRTIVIERAVLELKGKLDEATELLPKPDDDQRGALLKAKDAITGG